MFPPGIVQAICEHLEACTRGEIRRLIINVPPRCMKSRLVSVFWPAWVWITHPHKRWLFSSYGQHLSLRDSRHCRDIILSSWYQRNWGQRFRLRDDQNQKVRFDNSHAGFRLASSTGGIGTGEGGDFIVTDDPHNVVEAESETQRESVLRWWDQSMSTRGNDPKTVCHVVVMQRLHECDLVGNVLVVKAGWNRAFIDELCVFPNGRNDDQVDSSSGAFNRLSRYAAYYEGPQFLPESCAGPAWHSVHLDRSNSPFRHGVPFARN